MRHSLEEGGGSGGGSGGGGGGGGGGGSGSSCVGSRGSGGPGLSSPGRAGERASLTAAELAARLAAEVDDLPQGVGNGTITTTLVLSARTRDALLYNFTVVCTESRHPRVVSGKGGTSPQTLQQRRRTQSSADDAYDLNEDMLRLATHLTPDGSRSPAAGAEHSSSSRHGSSLSGRLSMVRVGSAMTSAEMLDILQGIKV